MQLFHTVLPANDPAEPSLTLTLDHEQRRRSRLRVLLPNGEAVGFSLPRGTTLKDGDRLASESGTILRVQAASEHVSVASARDPELLARGAYHLGNRHAVVRIEPGRLLYPHDVVLDHLCRELGLELSEQITPFEPESGGYSSEHSHPPEQRLAPPGKHG